MAITTDSWSYERLLQLAPDAASLEQARRLFFAKRWQLLQGNGEWLWGEYLTAYGHLHQAAVRLEPPGFHCSCKQQRQPCKHSLALVLLFLNRPEAWQVSNEPPPWVQKLTEKKTTVGNAPSSPSQAQQDKRLLLMDQGVVELDKWLRNIAHQGLATIADTPEEWDNIAMRMVDSKMGGIARQIRHCRALLKNDDWIDPLTGELGLLYLFARTWQRKSSLTPSQKRELLQVAGWNIRKENLSSDNAVKDNWLVLGLSTGVEEKLRFRRTWLRGEKTKRCALLLDFAFGNRSFEDHWVIGSVLEGRLLFYPGQPQIRAVFQHYQPSRKPYDSQPGYTTFPELQLEYAKALEKSPWLMVFPALLDEAIPQYDQINKQFFLLDKNKTVLPMFNTQASWKLLAISGGRELTVFGEYEGTVFRANSVFSEGRVVPL